MQIDDLPGILGPGAFIPLPEAQDAPVGRVALTNSSFGTVAQLEYAVYERDTPSVFGEKIFIYQVQVLNSNSSFPVDRFRVSYSAAAVRLPLPVTGPGVGRIPAGGSAGPDDTDHAYFNFGSLPFIAPNYVISNLTTSSFFLPGLFTPDATPRVFVAFQSPNPTLEYGTAGVQRNSDLLAANAEAAIPSAGRSFVTVYEEGFESGPAGWGPYAESQIEYWQHVATAPPGSDISGALWAGLDTQLTVPPGYGDFWDTIVQKNFPAPNGTALLMDLTHIYDTEINFDFCYVETSADDGATWTERGQWTGLVPPLPAVTETVALGNAGPNGLLVRLRFQSDSGYDDEDGLYDSTYGAWYVDEITVRSSDFGITFLETNTFDTGFDGWAATTRPEPSAYRLEIAPPVPDGIEDRPPEESNNTWVAYDPVTGLLPEPTFDGRGTLIGIQSPSIDVPLGTEDFLVRFDAYRGAPIATGLRYDLQASFDGGPWLTDSFVYVGTTWGSNVLQPIVANPELAESVRLRLVAYDFVNDPLNPNTPGPYFDNIELVALGPVPLLTLLQAPEEGQRFTTNDDVLFEFAANSTGYGPEEHTYEVVVNGGDPIVVDPSVRIFTLQAPSDGQYNVEIRAQDPDGGQAAVARNFTVDASAPTLTITSGPLAGQIFTPDVDFNWTLSDAVDAPGDIVVEASLDDGPFEILDPNTGVSYTGLAAGPHTLDLRATDLSGNVLDLPGAAAFEVVLYDLTIASLTLPDVQAQGFAEWDQPLTIEWSITNAGASALPATGWADRFVLSRDEVVGNDVLLSSVLPREIALGPGETSVVFRVDATTDPFVLDYPGLGADAGPWFLGLVTDVTSQLNEYEGENNNVQFVPLTIQPPEAPDLTVADIAGPVQALSGEFVELSWTVGNAGTVDAPPGWQESVYLSPTATFDPATATLLRSVEFGQALPAGETITRVDLVSLPADAEGPSWFVVAVDTANPQLIQEYGGETNNAAVSEEVTVERRPYPDLSISNVASANAVIAGNDLSVSWTVTNVGGAETNATAWRDEVILSRDQDALVNPIVLASVPNPLFLLSGGTYTQTNVQVLVPDGIGGTWFVHVVTDANDRVDEQDEIAPNRASAPVAVEITLERPFLVAENVVVPTTSPFAGTEITVDYSVLNDGDRDFTNSLWIDQIRLSPDPEPSVGDIVLGDSDPHTVALPVDQVDPGTATVRLPFLIEGPWYVIVVPTGETDAETPVLTSAALLDVLPSPPPDLTIVAPSEVTPTQLDSGDELNVLWTVQDAGLGPINGDTWIDRVYLSIDGQLDPETDALILEQDVSRDDLSGVVSSAYQFNRTVRLDNRFDGIFQVLLAVDADDQVVGEVAAVAGTEGESSNVQSLGTVEILRSPPDLVASTITPAVSLASGQTVDVTVSFENAGVGTAAASVWRDRLILSVDDQVGGGDDVEIVTVSRDEPVLAGGNYDVVYAVEVPDAFTGPAHLIAIADLNDDVEEFEFDTNNVTVVAVDVALTPPADLTVASIEALSEPASGRPLSIRWTLENVGAGSTDGRTWTDTVYLSTDDTLDPATDVEIGDTTSSFLINGGGGTQAIEATVDLPEDAVGARFIFVRTNTDPADFVFEDGQTANNDGLLALDVALTPPPDLVATSFIGPATGVIGDPIDVEWIVENQGPGTTEGAVWTDRLVLSSDLVVDENDRVLQSFAYDGTADGTDGGYAVSTSVVVPSVDQGSYFLLLSLDDEGEVFEYLSEDNNVASSAIIIQLTDVPVPDLALLNLAATSPVTGGERVALDVQWRVENPSENPVPAIAEFFTDTVYLSDDDVFDLTDEAIAAFNRPAVLPAGQGIDVTETIELPLGTNGSKWLFVRTDSGQDIVETDDTNNDGVAAVDIVVDPVDLQVFETVAAPAVISGQDLPLNWTVVNEGTGLTAAQQWRDSVYLSRDQVLDSGDTKLGEVVRDGALGAGNSYITTGDLRVPLGISGTFFAIVATDTGDEVFEEGAEANNVRASRTLVQVQLPTPTDLSLTGVSTPPSAVAGDDLTVSWTVQNTGEEPVQGFWQDAVFLSLDDQYSSDDILLGSAATSETLPPGATYESSVVLSRNTLARLASEAFGQFDGFAPGVMPDDYRILVRADALNDVFEINEQNNVAPSLTTIGVDVQTLEIGISLLVGFDTDRARFVRVPATASGDVQVTFTLGVDPEAEFDVYVGNGFVPSPVQNVRAETLTDGATINLPSTTGAETFLTLIPSAASLGLTVQLDALGLDPGITAVSPRAGGQSPSVTIAVEGAGFEPDASVALLPPGAAPDDPVARIEALEVFVRDRTRLLARFDLENVPLGQYGLVIDYPDGPRVAPGGFRVVAPTNLDAPLIVNTSFPRNVAVRETAAIDYVLTVTNLANYDAEVVVLRLATSGLSGVRMRAVDDLIGTESQLMSLLLGNDEYSTVIVPGGLRAGSSLTIAFRMENALPGVWDFYPLIEVLTREEYVAYELAMVDGLAGRISDVRDLVPGIEADFWDTAEAPDVAPAVRTILEQDVLELVTLAGSRLSDRFGRELKYTSDVARVQRWIEAAIEYRGPFSPLARKRPTAAQVEALAPLWTAEAFDFNVDALVACESDGACDAAVDFPGSNGFAIVSDALRCDGNDALYLNAVVSGGTLTVRVPYGTRGCQLEELRGVLVYAVSPDQLTVNGVRTVAAYQKVGPLVNGAPALLAEGQLVSYTIFFENPPSATAPARRVVIGDPLNTALDERTVRFTGISFAGTNIVPSADASAFQTTVPLSNGFDVLVSASVDAVTRRIAWTLETRDPATGLPPTDNQAGFLPPEDGNGAGLGSVSFTVQVAAGVSPGDVIRNTAEITVDANATVQTNRVENAVRAAQPDLAVASAALDVERIPVREGDLIRVAYVIENQGESPARTVTANVVATSDGQDPIALATFDLGDVAPGEGKFRDLEWDLRGITGPWAITVEVDPDSTVVEAIETNNRRVTTVIVAPRQAVIAYGPGLNLVAWPLETTQNTARDLTNVLGSEYLVRLLDTGEFEAFIPGLQVDDGWNLVGEDGYLVNLAAAVQATYSGGSHAPTVSLQQGANLAAVPVADPSITSARQLASATGANSVIRLGQASGRFEAFVPDFNTDDGFPVGGGEGYFVTAAATATVELQGLGWFGTLAYQSNALERVVPEAAVCGPIGFVFGGALPASSGAVETVRVENLRTEQTTRTPVRADRTFGAVLLDLGNEPVACAGDVLVAIDDASGEEIVRWTLDQDAVERGLALYGSDATDAADAAVPRVTRMLEPYPNPFNPKTIIRYDVANAGRVSLAIYNIRGRLVKTLVREDAQPGSYVIEWNGIDNRGSQVASGLYLVRFVGPEARQNRKITLLK